MLIRCRSFVGVRHTSAASWFLVGVLMLVSCSAPEIKPPASVKPCVAGELTLPDGRCQPAGLPLDRQCDPGELALEDGTCQSAGVPSDACGEGFVPDGKQGCESILPTEECPFGMMAVPGEAECHEVAPCGNGTWGDIPVDANTQFVDQAYAGNDSDGTKAKPWKTIQEGIYYANEGAIVAVAAGTYAEDLWIQGKPVRLWGRCPAMVEVAGAGVTGATIVVTGKQALGTEVRDVSVTGAQIGIGVLGVPDIQINETWIHDAERGLVVASQGMGPTSVVLARSLIEQNNGVGVAIAGSNATIDASTIRSTKPGAEGFAYGIQIYDDPDTRERANATIRGCLVEQNQSFGVEIWGSDATIEATVIRGTIPNAQGERGYGIGIFNDPTTKARANATIRSCFVEQNHEVGVYTIGSSATIETTVIRATAPNVQGDFGNGLFITSDPKADEPGNLTLRHCVVEENRNAGVAVIGADATIESTIIRTTQSNPDSPGWGIAILDDAATSKRSNATVVACRVEENSGIGVVVQASDAIVRSTVIRGTKLDPTGHDGRGIMIQNGEMARAHERAHVMVESCLVEQNQYIGVSIAGSDATIETTIIRATQPDASADQVGIGIAMGEVVGSGERANATIRGCLVEQNHMLGVFTNGADATFEGTTISDTMPTTNGRFGDGLWVQGGIVKVEGALVTRNSRAGIVNFASQIAVSSSTITCNAFNLEGAVWEGVSFSYAGSSGWACTKRGADDCTIIDECTVQSSGLEPPPPLSF